MSAPMTDGQIAAISILCVVCVAAPIIAMLTYLCCRKDLCHLRPPDGAARRPAYVPFRVRKNTDPSAQSSPEQAAVVLEATYTSAEPNTVNEQA